KDDKTADVVDFNSGGLIGSEIFSSYNLEEIAEKIVHRAVNKLNAVACPSGVMPVVIANNWGGIIFHEACGHSLEATSIAPKRSVFSDKLGQRIASDVVTAIDDATIPHAWGSINIDDEGTLTQRKVLIENGILKNYMIDKFNGRRMGMPSNGSARRQDYTFIPTSRMSNTMILNGKSTKEEIIDSTPYGIYAKAIGAGCVNPATGEFNFTVDEAFLIEKGKITQQLKGVKLIGRGQDILLNIDMVGNDMLYGPGYCGSISGTIPITVGQPTIRVQGLTVGGQK
ncbi:MAG: TldD/PmbA family protein, partial [Alphaproteobacteria bacterium]|nr:TldD/PmbA family protein [Alphaproteobacteria bacterium]